MNEPSLGSFMFTAITDSQRVLNVLPNWLTSTITQFWPSLHFNWIRCYRGFSVPTWVFGTSEFLSTKEAVSPTTYPVTSHLDTLGETSSPVENNCFEVIVTELYSKFPQHLMSIKLSFLVFMQTLSVPSWYCELRWHFHNLSPLKFCLYASFLKIFFILQNLVPISISCMKCSLTFRVCRGGSNTFLEHR